MEETHKSLSWQVWRGAASAFVVNVLGLFTAFALQLVLARLLGKTGFGAYSYVISWLGVLVLVATLGLETALIRFIPAYVAQGEWSSLQGLFKLAWCRTLILSAVVGVLLFTVALTLAGLIAVDLRNCFLAGAILLPLWALNNVRQAALRAFKAVLRARLPDVVIRPAALLLMLGVFFWLRDGEVSAAHAMLLHVAAAVLALICGTVFLQKVRPLEAFKASPSYHTSLWLRTSLPLMVINVLQMLLNEVDKIILGSSRSLAEVGLYVAAARVAYFMVFVLDVFSIIAAPLIAECHATETKDRLQQLMSRLALYIGLGSMPIFLILIAGGPWLIRLFGSQFAPAYPVLVILVFGHLGNVLFGPVGLLLTMTGHHVASLRILLCTLISYVAILIPAISWWGTAGAAAAMAVAVFMRNILGWVVGKRSLEIDASLFRALGQLPAQKRFK